MKFKKIKIFLVVLVVIIGGGLFAVTRGLKEGKNLVINNVDMSKIEDGTYYGKYSKGRWTSEVQVTVSNNKVEDIETMSLPSPLNSDDTDKLSKEVIDQQSINVDVISGATVGSKAYLKSVENALNK